MIIAVAGPYSAPTEEERAKNLERMNRAAARLLEMGHVPLIGMNAALPVLEFANVEDRYKAVMDISLATVANADAILLLAESPGANKERDLLISQGKKVYTSIEEIVAEKQEVDNDRA